MTAPLFYGNAQDVAQAKVGDEVIVGGDEGRHAVTVKRLSAGEPVLVGDGAGRILEGLVASTRGKSELVVEVRRVTASALPEPRITVVQGLIKGERLERAVETMTEAGVDRIVLWQSQRSIVRIGDDAGAKVVAKLRAKAMNAAKQARRAWVPVVELAISTAEVAAAIADSPVRIALHEEADKSLAEELRVRGATGASVGDVALVIGPEGGISPTELEQLSAAQVVPTRMGSPILRSSTAGTVALGWVMGATGRWTVGD